MKAGQLRNLITIQSAVEHQNPQGESIVTWSDVADVWASVHPLSGRELFNAQQVQPDITHEVKLRYYGALTAKHRFLHDGRALNIESVADTNERNVEHVCACREAV